MTEAERELLLEIARLVARMQYGSHPVCGERFERLVETVVAGANTSPTSANQKEIKKEQSK
jgi:hypothetical protein